jgi:cytochrome c oxidase assembly factor CtaG
MGSIPAHRFYAVTLGGLLAALAAGGSIAAEAGSPIDLLTLCLATLPEARPDRIWTEWSLAPTVVVPVVLTIGLYVWGFLTHPRERHRPTFARRAYFAAGIGCLIVALMSPLCRIASTLAWAHMVQHVLLVVGAPLLLVLSRPGGTLVAGLPRRLRTRAFSWASAAAARSQPHAYLIATFLLYGVNIWFWHVPALYEAALLDTGMHLLMYASLLIVSLMFWHAVVETYRMPGSAAGTAAILLFFTFLHTGALGIVLTLSPRVLYPVMALRGAAWGLLPIDDQRLAGLIMWIPIGGVYVVVALAVLARLIATSGRLTDGKASAVRPS